MSLERLIRTIRLALFDLFGRVGVFVDGVETFDSELDTRRRPLGCFGGAMNIVFGQKL